MSAVWTFRKLQKTSKIKWSKQKTYFDFSTLPWFQDPLKADIKTKKRMTQLHIFQKNETLYLEVLK